MNSLELKTMTEIKEFYAEIRMVYCHLVDFAAEKVTMHATFEENYDEFGERIIRLFFDEKYDEENFIYELLKTVENFKENQYVISGLGGKCYTRHGRKALQNFRDKIKGMRFIQRFIAKNCMRVPYEVSLELLAQTFLDKVNPVVYSHFAMVRNAATYPFFDAIYKRLPGSYEKYVNTKYVSRELEQFEKLIFKKTNWDALVKNVNAEKMAWAAFGRIDFKNLVHHTTYRLSRGEKVDVAAFVVLSARYHLPIVYDGYFIYISPSLRGLYSYFGKIPESLRDRFAKGSSIWKGSPLPIFIEKDI